MGLAWVVLRSKANGHAFLFTTTHLDPPNRTVRRGAVEAADRQVRRLQAAHSRWSASATSTPRSSTRSPRRCSRDEGPASATCSTSSTASTRPRGPRREAHQRLDQLQQPREPQRALLSYPSDHAKTGNSIDYIFASNRLRVKEFKLVLHFNPRTLRVTGTIASDHNMLRATIRLP